MPFPARDPTRVGSGLCCGGRERGREEQAQLVSDSAWERRTGGEGWKSGARSWRRLLVLDFLRVV